jgi:hypothetical protein
MGLDYKFGCDGKVVRRPDSVPVACNHSEKVIAGWQAGIIGHAPSTCSDPGSVEAIEPVSVL